jgi:flagellar biosynthesis chaperone FliJ
MQKRRIAALELIERLKTHEMEGEVRELGLLHGRIDALEQERRALFGRLESEAHIVSIEAAPYVGNFIRAIREEIAARDREIDRLDRQAEKLEAAVREKYHEVKTFSVALEQTRSALARDRDRRAAAALEEQVSLRWKRRSGASGSHRRQRPGQGKAES